MILIFLNKKQNSFTGLVIFMIMSLGIEILNNDAVNVPFDDILFVKIKHGFTIF